MPHDPAGSNWRKWDLHFHTPSSFDYKDKSVTNEDIVAGLKAAHVSAVAITDHHLIDVDRIKTLQSLSGPDLTIFPGIELRSELGGSETVHFIGIFPEDADVDGLWAMIQGQLEITPQEVRRKGDDSIYVNFEQGARIIHDNGGLLSIHAGKKTNSIENIRNTAKFKMAFKKDLAERHIDLLEVSSATDLDTYRTKVFPSIGFPLPLIIGSDNHNIRSYKSPLPCWIKADCTFLGLCHVLHEPNGRIFVGDTPPALTRVAQHKTRYIRSVAVRKTPDSSLAERWFDSEIPLNHGLIAIVGNKGSGKTALADIIGLLGNSRKSDSFSFLAPSKFRHPKENKADHFQADIVWHSGQSHSRRLSEVVDHTDVETVRYIPQDYLEDICNELALPHQSGFNRELEAVIYSHVQEADRLGQPSLNDLVNYRTRETRKAISRHGDVLHDAVKRFVTQCEYATDSHRKTISNKLKAKQEELEAHRAVKPTPIAKPTSDPAIQSLTAEIERNISDAERALAKTQSMITVAQQQRLHIKMQLAAAVNFDTRLTNLLSDIDSFKSESLADCEHLGLKLDDILTVSVDTAPLLKRRATLEADLQSATDRLGVDTKSGLTWEKKKTEDALVELRNSLDAPNKFYQTYLADLKAWEDIDNSLVGSAESPDTIRYYEERLRELDVLPSKVEASWRACLNASLAIYNELTKLAEALDSVFGPAQSFAENHPLAKGRYDLRFEAALIPVGFPDHVLSYINQGRRGSFSGVEEGRARLNDILNKASFERPPELETFLNLIRLQLTHDHRRSPPDAVSIHDQISKGHTAEELLTYVLGLEYLLPQVTLRWSGKNIDQLSPGERGTLLLVFYLLIDRSETPLVIDQPEENLDNQTVVEFLVPSIMEARDRRQIIIVTHNPNLAVVCDADQVICARMDKQDGNAIEYECGAIENRHINKRLLDILEGTRFAFDNRDGKYQSEKSQHRPRHRYWPMC